MGSNQQTKAGLKGRITRSQIW